MIGDELRAILTEFAITQADFARLTGVTARAVTLWIGDERRSQVRLVPMCGLCSFSLPIFDR